MNDKTTNIATHIQTPIFQSTYLIQTTSLPAPPSKFAELFQSVEQLAPQTELVEFGRVLDKFSRQEWSAVGAKMSNFTSVIRLQHIEDLAVQYLGNEWELLSQKILSFTTDYVDRVLCQKCKENSLYKLREIGYAVVGAAAEQLVISKFHRTVETDYSAPFYLSIVYFQSLFPCENGREKTIYPFALMQDAHARSPY